MGSDMETENTNLKPKEIMSYAHSFMISICANSQRSTIYFAPHSGALQLAGQIAPAVSAVRDCRFYREPRI